MLSGTDEPDCGQTVSPLLCVCVCVCACVCVCVRPCVGGCFEQQDYVLFCCLHCFVKRLRSG